MKKLLLQLRGLSDSNAILRSLVVICICFLVGAVAGGSYAAYCGSIDILVDVTSLPTAGHISIFDAAVTMFRYPILALLLGLALFGVVAEPLLAAARGFLLCFAGTALFRLYGLSGLLLAAARGTVECLISIPCFFHIAAIGMVNSAYLLSSIRGHTKSAVPFSKLGGLRLALLLLLISLGMIAELYITPVLVSAAAGAIQ